MEEFFGPAFRQQAEREQQYLDLDGLQSKGFAGIYNDLSIVDYCIDGSYGVFAKIGKMARANGLWIREPYLDRDAVDFVFGLPVERKTAGRFPGFASLPR